MNMYKRGGIFSSLPQVTRSLLIINIVVFIFTTLLFPSARFSNALVLFNLQSELFRPYQIITHMFMHASFLHLFFNMFALFMFGRVLENVWGSRKFFLLYFISGLGAAFLQLGINYLSINSFLGTLELFQNSPSPELFWKIVQKYHYAASNEAKYIAERYFQDQNSTEIVKSAWQELLKVKYHVVTISAMLGASGAVMGVVASFALLYPNVELMIIPIPIPIKAKYLIGGFILIDLVSGFINFSGGGGIAHFAHLGGALVGFILVRIWKNNQFKMY